ncbi:MAG: hypothetical protein L6Q75_14675 [Burkholderiaceae bacterium]|nr:hypothetical protein [Burkholderiaceae bacterium]
MTRTAQTRTIPGGPHATARGLRESRGAAILLLLALGLPAGAESVTGSGLRVDPVQAAHSSGQSPWSTRFEVAQAWSDPALSAPIGSRLGWHWLGDYRFAPAWGLRATGGMLGQLEQAGAGDGAQGSRIGQRRLTPLAGSIGLAAPRSGELLRATPYLGLGFDSAGVLRNGWGAWGLSADLGLVTRSDDGQGLRLDRPAPTDAGWRGLHLAPVLQVGVSYSF